MLQLGEKIITFFISTNKTKKKKEKQQIELTAN